MKKHKSRSVSNKTSSDYGDAPVNSIIDGPKDIIPAKLLAYADNEEYCGGAHTARVLRWSAEYIDKLHILLDKAIQGKKFLEDEL